MSKSLYFNEDEGIKHYSYISRLVIQSKMRRVSLVASQSSDQIGLFLSIFICSGLSQNQNVAGTKGKDGAEWLNGARLTRMKMDPI